MATPSHHDTVIQAMLHRTDLLQLGRVAADQSPWEATSAELKMRMMKQLSRTSDSVFKLSPDGTAYLAPDVLRGVPVKRIDESSPYWQKDWASLDTLLAAHEEAIQTKDEYRRRAEAFGILAKDANNERKEKKAAGDDCSKYTKIREIFGNGHGKYHPNQLVAKHYLPPGGLCEKDLLYKMACKISNLCDLYKTGKLAMDPYDFYRWAVCRNLDRRILRNLRTPRRLAVKSVIRSLGDDSSTCKSNDEEFRTMVLYWANLTDQEKRFRNPGSKRVRHRSSVPSNSRISTSLGGPKSADRRAAIEMKRRLEGQPRQRKKKTAAAVQGVGYTGVNALRAMQTLTINNVE